MHWVISRVVAQASLATEYREATGTEKGRARMTGSLDTLSGTMFDTALLNYQLIHANLSLVRDTGQPDVQ